MNNDERILQILTVMQQDVSGLKQDMTDVKQDISGLKQDMSEVKRDIASLSEHVDTQISRIDLTIENNIGKRLDALFDGYTLGSEKHIILENRVDIVEDRVDRLEIAAS